jgi:hypothetical protein
VPRVMDLNAFRQKALASALPPARECGPAAFRFHTRAKAVLAFARSLGCLVSALHSENLITRAMEERLS